MKNNLLLVLGFLGLCGVAIYFSNRQKGADPSTGGSTGMSASTGGDPSVDKGKVDLPPGEVIQILFSTSDGKKEWVEEVTKDFNARGLKVGDETVQVKLKHMKSGESLQKILSGEEKPHLWSPVSRSWIEQINGTWQVRNKQNFIDDAKPTVRTALVIAMWEPMARALGYPDKPVGWGDLVKVALDPNGWATYGHPEWGKFKFGHSHPDFSTSAMLSLISLLYAETGKHAGLTPDDLRQPKVVEGLTAIQRAIVHYGESSTWLTEKICTRGPSYLSAVSLYESSVVKANLKYTKKPFPLVAIYPKEGTFWENHPTGIVNADWVSDEQREAAKLYLAFLLAPEQQAKTCKGGFRPADPAAAITSPVDREHGADPAASDANALEQVSDEVFKRANALWHEVKKKATIYVLLDTSGSMQGDAMEAAKRGVQEFLKHMEPEDEVQVISFSTGVNPLGRLGLMRDVGEPLSKKVGGLFADGNTALYDAIGQAMDEIESARRTRLEPRLYGIVCLTDGKDTCSRTKKLDLMARLPKGEDTDSIKIFTISYGSDTDRDLLKEISERSNAVSLQGEKENVGKVYESISTYF